MVVVVDEVMVAVTVVRVVVERVVVEMVVEVVELLKSAARSALNPWQ